MIETAFNGFGAAEILAMATLVLFVGLIRRETGRNKSARSE